jgi:hypothetical protein
MGDGDGGPHAGFSTPRYVSRDYCSQQNIGSAGCSPPPRGSPPPVLGSLVRSAEGLPNCLARAQLALPASARPPPEGGGGPRSACCLLCFTAFCAACQPKTGAAPQAEKSWYSKLNKAGLLAEPSEVQSAKQMASSPPRTPPHPSLSLSQPPPRFMFYVL